MRKIPVKSRIIARIEYDPDLRNLDICFRNGEIRSLEKLPLVVVAGLLNAQSPGSFYIESIRNKFQRRTNIQPAMRQSMVA